MRFPKKTCVTPDWQKDEKDGLKENKEKEGGNTKYCFMAAL